MRMPLSKPLLQSFLPALPLLFAVPYALACSYGPRFAGPSGPRVHLYAIAQETFLFEKKRMGWDEFRKNIRARVQLALAGKAAHPRVVVHHGGHHIDGFGDRMLSLLQAAGVRSFDFPDR